MRSCRARSSLSLSPRKFHERNRPKRSRSSLCCARTQWRSFCGCLSRKHLARTVEDHGSRRACSLATGRAMICLRPCEALAVVCNTPLCFRAGACLRWSRKARAAGQPHLLYARLSLRQPRPRQLSLRLRPLAELHVLVLQSLPDQQLHVHRCLPSLLQAMSRKRSQRLVQPPRTA